MRVWLDPGKVAARGLAASDVVNAIREQNVQVAAGVVGAPPMSVPVDYQLTINARGRLTTEEEFGDIILKTGENGEITRLRDVARLELGAGDYALRSLLDGKEAVGIGIVVVDAIVVVENVERNIEAGLSPRDAAHKAMDEVSRPIVAIGLVLCAVFVPVGFLSGLTGEFYRQFALTIAFSTVISAINSLTLSPA